MLYCLAITLSTTNKKIIKLQTRLLISRYGILAQLKINAIKNILPQMAGIDQGTKGGKIFGNEKRVWKLAITTVVDWLRFIGSRSQSRLKQMMSLQDNYFKYKVEINRMHYLLATILFNKRVYKVCLSSAQDTQLFLVHYIHNCFSAYFYT